MEQNELEMKKDAILAEYAKMKGVRKEFGQFYIGLLDDLSLVIGSADGWKTIYSPMTEPWVMLTAWLNEWDESSKARESVEGFVKAIVFPTSVRLSDIDSTYVDDIVKSHVSLSVRVTEKQEIKEKTRGFFYRLFHRNKDKQ